MTVVKLPSGKVKFSVKQLPGCCGVGVLHFCGFYIKPNKRYLSWRGFNYESMTSAHRRQFKSLFTEFDAYIKGRGVSPLNLRYPYDLTRTCIMMTDQAYGEIAEFCKHTKWKKSKPFINNNTGNKVTIFTYTRDGINHEEDY